MGGAKAWLGCLTSTLTDGASPRAAQSTRQHQTQKLRQPQEQTPNSRPRALHQCGRAGSRHQKGGLGKSSVRPGSGQRRARGGGLKLSALGAGGDAGQKGQAQRAGLGAITQPGEQQSCEVELGGWRHRAGRGRGGLTGRRVAWDRAGASQEPLPGIAPFYCSRQP